MARDWYYVHRLARRGFEKNCEFDSIAHNGIANNGTNIEIITSSGISSTDIADNNIAYNSTASDSDCVTNRAGEAE